MIAQVYPLRFCRCAAGEARDHHAHAGLSSTVLLAWAQQGKGGGEGVDLSYPG